MQKYLFIFIITCCFISCAPPKEEIPADVIAQGPMAEIIADIHLAEAFNGLHPKKGDTSASVTLGYYEVIYKKHGITKPQFDSSYHYYIHHPVMLDSVYNQVIEILSDRESELKRPQKKK